jgi:DNA-directed RNA polymerase subunit RPC12/RpoP
MENYISGKCNNCGAVLKDTEQNSAKCTYCGTEYKTQKKQPILADPEKKTVVQENLSKSDTQDASERTKAASAVGVVFLMFVGILVILAVINKQNNFVEKLNSSPTVVVDSTPAPYNQLSYSDAVTESEKKQIKRPFPDPEILVSGEVSTNSTNTYIVITIKNNTNRKANILYADIGFRILDKDGVTLKTGEANQRHYELNLAKGESKSEKWTIQNRVPKAKSMFIKLRKVAFDDVLWFY